MSEAHDVHCWKNDGHSGDQPVDHPSGIIRLLPVVTFGLRAAALAGLIVGGGGVAARAAGLGEFTDGNTCCVPTDTGVMDLDI
jgi:hypothetical protein